MDSKELSDICTQDFLINKIFRGVYSIDNIPEILPNTAFIVNLSKHDEFGTHCNVKTISFFVQEKEDLRKKNYFHHHQVGDPPLYQVPGSSYPALSLSEVLAPGRANDCPTLVYDA